MQRFMVFLCLTFSLVFVPSCLFASQGSSSQVGELLRIKIDVAGDNSVMYAAGKPVHAVDTLSGFYELRNFEPAWLVNGKPTENVNIFLTALKTADQHGLRPEIYHVSTIDETLEALKKMEQTGPDPDIYLLVDLELLLTDSFLTFGSHLLAGQVNPETFDPEWIANRRGADMAMVLQNALNFGNIYESLRSLWPKHEGYVRLHETFNQYRLLLENGAKWPLVPPGPKMELGDRNDRVAMLRARLADEPELQGEFLAGETDLFDNSLEMAVMDFQNRHGLDVDGIVGRATLAALNTSLEEKVERIRLNLERWRWIPEDLGVRNVQVNIANFHLKVVEQEQTVLEMKIIVGKDYRKTPVFSDKIYYMVLNPSWNVPRSIAINDKLPLIRKNPGYLVKQKMRVYSSWKSGAREINPYDIDWGTVTKSNFRYRLRQEPGPNNALGRIKFMFPNRFNVYLHDTPSRELFNKTSRTFSSGCIRIQKPEELALYLLKDDPRWTPEKFQKTLDTMKEQSIRLPSPVPVHLLYWTVFVDDDGVVQFRNDIYGRDAQLAKALEEKAGT
ncbi:MAG: L,D-transpeptidase family protein [Desulfobacterales bacterium]|nr:L,D-transpeptidase family protein [Desulfobacterales bacterium]